MTALTRDIVKDILPTIRIGIRDNGRTIVAIGSIRENIHSYRKRR